jgi:histidine triad (HIT) family protein
LLAKFLQHCEKNDRVTAFNDITPQAPTHVLIIPNQHFHHDGAGSDCMIQSLVGEIIPWPISLQRIGLESYRTNINTGADAGQSVFHAHLHLLGGRAFAGHLVKYTIICNGPQSY